MKERYSEVTKQIFTILAVAGIGAVVVTAPGALLVLKLFAQNGQQFPKKYTEKQAIRSLRGLQNKKFVEIKEKSGKFEIRLTKRGREKFREIRLSDLKVIKSPRWDKKWRLVIFDIPDKSHKYGREALRSKLKEWDFYQLQKSVWICPWPCEEEIHAIGELYNILPYVNIVIAEKIVDDTLAKKHFRL